VTTLTQRDYVLELVDASAGYGDLPVLEHLDLGVAKGEVVALLGSNGAGKSTTLLLLAGELTASHGEVRWKGVRTRAPLHRRASQGLRFVPEDRGVIFGLTTDENLRLGGGNPDDAYASFPELAKLRTRPARLLSGGEQQMLTLARALSSSPDVLLVDELSLGLAPIIVIRLLEALRIAATERQVGIILVEQHVAQALTVADRGYVLHRGQIAKSGSRDELLAALDEIESIYLSAEVNSAAVEQANAGGRIDV